LSPMARDAFVIGGVALAIVQTWLAIFPVSSVAKTRASVTPESNVSARSEWQPAIKPRKPLAEQPVENAFGLLSLIATALLVVFGCLGVIFENSARGLDILLGFANGACMCVSGPAAIISLSIFLKKTEEMEPSIGRVRRRRILMAWSSLTLLCAIDIALTKATTVTPLGWALVYMWASLFLSITLLWLGEYLLRRYDII